MNRQAYLLRRFATKDLLAASGAHYGRNAAGKNILTVDVKDLVDYFFPAFFSMADRALKHAYRFVKWSIHSSESGSYIVTILTRSASVTET